MTWHCQALKLQMASLEAENDSLKSKLEDAENNVRQENLVIHGLDEELKEM